MKNFEHQKELEQQRQQAQADNTSADMLSQLAKSEDETTRRNVAANPNTPPER